MDKQTKEAVKRRLERGMDQEVIKKVFGVKDADIKRCLPKTKAKE